MADIEEKPKPSRTKKYQIIMVNGQISAETEKLEIDDQGRLNVWYRPDENSDLELVMQINSRGWIAWMRSEGPPSIIPANPGMVPGMGGFPPRNRG